MSVGSALIKDSLTAAERKFSAAADKLAEVRSNPKSTDVDVNAALDDYMAAHQAIGDAAPAAVQQSSKAPLIAAGVAGSAALLHPDDVEASVYDSLLKTTKGLKGTTKFLTDEERRGIAVKTAANYVELRKALPSSDEMALVARAGAAKKGWYKDSMNAIIHVFGEDAPRFTALLAAQSPRTSVEANLRNALTTWVNWEAEGRPTSKPQIMDILGRSIQGNKGEESVLDAWRNNSMRALMTADPHNIVLSGPKVTSFQRNLMGVMHEVTNDTWMGYYMNTKKVRDMGIVPDKMFEGGGKTLPDAFDMGSGPLAGKGKAVYAVKDWKYNAVNDLTRETADKLTKQTGEEWTPANVQEAVWSYVKTAKDKKLKASEMTDAHVADTAAFNTLFHDPRYRDIIARNPKLAENLNTLEPNKPVISMHAQNAYAEDPKTLDKVVSRLSESKKAPKKESGFARLPAMAAAGVGAAGTLIGQLPRAASNDFVKLGDILTPGISLDQAKQHGADVANQTPEWHSDNPDSQAMLQKLSDALGSAGDFAKRWMPGVQPAINAYRQLPPSLQEAISTAASWAPVK